MTKKYDLEKVIGDYHKESLSRSVPNDFSEKTMDRINREFSSRSVIWLNDNLWVLIMIISVLGVIIVSSYKRDLLPESNSINQLLASIKARESYWVRMCSFGLTGIFYYLLQMLHNRLVKTA